MCRPPPIQNTVSSSHGQAHFSSKGSGGRGVCVCVEGGVFLADTVPFKPTNATLGTLAKSTTRIYKRPKQPTPSHTNVRNCSMHELPVTVQTGCAEKETVEDNKKSHRWLFTSTAVSNTRTLSCGGVAESPALSLPTQWMSLYRHESSSCRKPRLSIKHCSLLQ